MNVMSKSEVTILRIIADEVDKILRSKNSITIPNLSLTKTLERYLPELTMGKDIEVIWDTTRPMEPYIMAMYPDPEELHKKSKELFDILVDADGIKGKPSRQDAYKRSMGYTDKWMEIQHWQLYIDIRLIDRESAISVASGDQFSAILAHEIGHVMNGDPAQLLQTYRENLYQQSKLERMLLSNNFFVRKIALPVFVNTLQFRVVLNKADSAAEELAADGYIPEEFRGAMVDYVTNRLLKTTAGSRVVITREEYKAEHRMAIKYHRSTIILLTKRRDILKRRLDAQYNSPAINPYLKNLVKFCAAGVTGFKPEDGTENLLEESTFATSALESVHRTEVDMSMMEGTKVTDRDLTMLELDIDDIKNSDDKLWCIQTIYDYIEAIEKEQEKKNRLASKKGVALPKELTKDPRLDRLWKMRNKVTAMKVSDTGPVYGVFVQYPKGYEG